MKKRSFIMIGLALGLWEMTTSGLQGATFEVRMTPDFAFIPEELTINVGDTVVWINTGGTHSTTSGTPCLPDELWSSPILSLSQTFERQFTTPGTFPYFCNFSNHCEEYGMRGTITVMGPTASLPLPTSLVAFPSVTATSNPVLSTNPADASPIGLGPVAVGLNSLEITIGTVAFSGPVDAYLAVYAPQALGNEIFLLSGGAFHAYAEEGLVPWLTSTMGPLNEPLFGTIPLSLLPPGSYTIFFAVTPAGSLLTNSYLWRASFAVP